MFHHRAKLAYSENIYATNKAKSRLFQHLKVTTSHILSELPVSPLNLLHLFTMEQLSVHAVSKVSLGALPSDDIIHLPR